ncbi:FeoB-associated Cys-rich membrane protein [Parabacteroides sp. AM08-6]|nr:FeoB-associated Cys-rich membrane protein [Parabacteroides sp. AM08-6]
MWQEIAIIIIGVITIGYIGWKIYSFLTQSSNTDMPCCHGCSKCALKNEMKKTR